MRAPLRLLLALTATVVTSSACGGADGDAPATADAETPLVLGFLPAQQADSILPDAERLGAFLAERLGRPVDVVVPTTYEPLIEGLRFGHVDIAFLDGGPAWIAHSRTGAEVILAEQQDGNTFYWAEAFTRAGSPITSIRDVPGKRLAFTSRTGSSGFLMPIGSMIRDSLVIVDGQELTDLDAALQRSFASTIDAGGYAQALTALLDGRVDVAFGAHDSPERFLEPSQRAQITSFHRFGKIPSHAVLVASDVPDDLAARIRDAMLALNDPANLPLLRAIYGVDGLVATTTADHLGDFGAALSALPGMERTLLTKAP